MTDLLDVELDRIPYYDVGSTEEFEFVCVNDALDNPFFGPRASIDWYIARGHIEKDIAPEYTFMATSWTAAMTEHHRRQGWQPYEPMQSMTTQGRVES